MELRILARRCRGAGLVAVALALGACGGGGGGNSPPPTPNPPPPPPVTVSLTVTPTTILEGDSVQITWSSTQATSCVAAILLGIPVTGWDGQIPTSGTRTVGPLDRVTEFGLNCSGPGGSVGSIITGVQVTPSPPTLSLQVTPRIVREGQTAQLTWTGNRLTACEASSNWSGTRPTAGSETVGPFTQGVSRQYVLSCTTARGDTISQTAFLDFRLGANQPPVANAGPDRSAGSAQRVDLEISGSHDDHTIVSSSWTQVGGPLVSLGPGFSPVSASFTAPIVPTDTVLTFALTVTDDEGLTSAPDTVNITILPIPPVVTISGEVRYERVPHGIPGTGLRYTDLSFTAVTDVLVEVLDASTQSVIASGTFASDFHFDVPGKTDLRLRATAESSRQAPMPFPHWEISVRDLDAAGASLGDVYSYTGSVFNSSAGGRQTLDIPSGWNTAGQLVGPRAAAAFAILDTLRDGMDDLLPNTDLPPLIVDWSPTNAGGETFFSADPGGTARIVLAGEADVDTDEYDPFVILHEFGHFLMHTVSRDDSLGGAHAIGDRVDMRVAVSEGFATGFSTMSIGESLYRDSFGPGQHNSGFFPVTLHPDSNDGWYSESSVQEVLWEWGDLGRTWDALINSLRDADALVSPFALFTALKERDPGRAATMNFLLESERIVGATIDAYGSTETNNAGSLAVLPVYTPISLGSSVQLISTNQFGTGNKLATHRFLRLNLPATTRVRFEASSAAGRDPDLLVFRRGVSLGPEPGPANEDFTLVLQPGDYVLDVYDCGNADCNPAVTPGSINITVRVTSN